MLLQRESVSAGGADIAALVLAAGAATRMGRLKQLLPYNGRTLVARTVAQAMEARFAPIVVVTGAESAAVGQAIAELPIEIVVNEAWQTGMGSSITAGMRHLQGRSLFAVAILLADQPLITASHLRELQRVLKQSGAQAVAAEYHGMVGVPAIFHRDLFARLLSLPGNVGARQLLRDRQLEIRPYPLPEAAIDIDTPADFAGLKVLQDHNI